MLTPVTFKQNVTVIMRFQALDIQPVHWSFSCSL